MISRRPLLLISLCSFLTSCDDREPYPVAPPAKEPAETVKAAPTEKESEPEAKPAPESQPAPESTPTEKESEPAPEPKESPAKSQETVTLLPGDLPDPATQFVPVTEKIAQTLKKEPAGEMKPYTETVPMANNATFDLVPIPGGEFQIGSPESEPGHRPDEAPRRTVKIEPFWMASTEITWGIYLKFMENGKGRNKNGTLNRDGKVLTEEPPFEQNPDLIDAISQPTPPYIPMHRNLGDGAGYDKAFPAIAMTQHAASKFCEWLTAQTGHYYRLPTEAEWEYACRAGTTTAFSFGDDISQLGDYAWYVDNSDFTYQPVGKKKPNPWGLYDMHGNVREWTLDAYLPDYQKHPDGALNPLALTPKRYPRVTRGGDWDSDPEDLRSAIRLPSKQSWKATDPQEPKSIWYHTDIFTLGFRVIRPAKTPSVEEMHLLWNTGPGERF